MFVAFESFRETNSRVTHGTPRQAITPAKGSAQMKVVNMISQSGFKLQLRQEGSGSTAQWQLCLGLEWRIIKAYDVTMIDRDDSDLRSPYAGVLCTAAPGQASSPYLPRGRNSGQTRNCQSALSQPSHSSQLCDSDGTIGQ
jgi:hypothetical protein